MKENFTADYVRSITAKAMTRDVVKAIENTQEQIEKLAKLGRHQICIDCIFTDSNKDEFARYFTKNKFDVWALTQSPNDAETKIWKFTIKW